MIFDQFTFINRVYGADTLVSAFKFSNKYRRPFIKLDITVLSIDQNLKIIARY